MENPRESAVAESRPPAERRTPRQNRAAPAPQVTNQHADPADLKNPALYINRELSWLEFNERVLAQARDPSHPLLERVKFLGITGTNLDEFFMIRVATTLKKLREEIEDVAPDGYNTEQQLEAMRARARRMLSDQASTWAELRKLLEKEQISFLDEDAWTPAVREHLSTYFSREICPVLTPLAFDPGHPFPFISNLSKNFAVVVKHGGRTKFARVKMPDVLPRFIPVPQAISPVGGTTYVFIEDVIRANIQELFSGTQVKGAYLFRIVRDTDLEIEEDEADDLLESIDRSLRQLRRGAISLLHVEASMPTRVLNILAENFEVSDEVVLRTQDRLGFGDWSQLTRLHRPELKDAPFSPHSLWRNDEDPEVIFDQIRYQDILVHHPFQSFASVETFLRAAVQDAHVTAIKMTLYRIGSNSPLIPLLIAAAEAGKQVAVLVELKARFDERNNILWAKRLEIARHPRRVRLHQSEDARQALSRRPAGSRRDSALRAYGHRELQPRHREDVHGPRSLHRGSGHRQRRLRRLQLPDRLLESEGVPGDDRRARAAPAAPQGVDRAGDRARPGGPSGAVDDEGQRRHRRSDDPAALSRGAGGRVDGPDGARHLLPASWQCRASATTSASARSSAASSSTHASTGSITTDRKRCTSGART